MRTSVRGEVVEGYAHLAQSGVGGGCPGVGGVRSVVCREGE
ncbi:hypothetical protein AB0C59_27335 [Streptomyces sp. NPDC048664]